MPEPGHWRFSASLVGTPLHIEHVESENVVTPYWHDQHLVVAELNAIAVRGVAPGIAASISVPVRYVRDRIQFRDLAGQPYVPPIPDQHHRNETLIRPGDVALGLAFERPLGAWSAAVSPGISIPTGRTEANPFALGRLGLPHQHIQFGTGTWDPMLSVSALRAAGAFTWIAGANARWSLYDNPRGFRAGDRYGLRLDAGRTIGGWNAKSGLSFSHERAERWDGRIEEEGNLGRTDLDLVLGLGRTTAIGTWALNAQIPMISRSTGSQVRYPVIVSTTWSR